MGLLKLRPFPPSVSIWKFRISTGSVVFLQPQIFTVGVLPRERLHLDKKTILRPVAGDTMLKICRVGVGQTGSAIP